MIKFSSSLKLNGFTKLTALSKNIGFQKYNLFPGDPNFGEGRSENLEKMSNNRSIYCYANREVVNFERIVYIPDQVLGKDEKAQFSGQNLTFL